MRIAKPGIKFFVKRFTVIFLMASISFILLLAVASCGKESGRSGKKLKIPDESFLKYGDTNETIVELNRVNSSVWVHTSYYEHDGELVPSNGLVIAAGNGLVLIDTTRTEKQMESLGKLADEAFNSSFEAAIISNAYPDRMGGASYLIKNKVPIYSLETVAKTAEQKGFIVPDKVIDGDCAIVDVGDIQLEIFYPGWGCTGDNTVVWFEEKKVLFAGDLVLEYGQNSLGERDESDINKWPDSIKAVQERYPDAEVVVPGHGQWGDKGLLDYTLSILEK